MSAQGTPRYTTAPELQRAISTEALVAAGVPRSSWLQKALRPLVWPPTHRFATLAAEFDRLVALNGFTAAVRWALSQAVDEARAFGTEHIPVDGPLVVASNHPGSYDGFVIASQLARDDLKVLVSDVPFLRNMVATSPHLIYTGYLTEEGYDPHGRMAVARESVRHLRDGGALLVFATGQVDPDPALLPGAQQALQRWSSSLTMFLRRVPEVKILPTMASGVLSPSCLNHPLTRLRKGQQEKQFLAEFIQISQVLLFGRRFGLKPEVRFAQPLTAAELDGGRDPEAALQAITARAQGLLDDIEQNLT